MRFFFSRHTPTFTRVLLVESGSRSLLDNLIPGLYQLYGDDLVIDLLTCYPGAPAGFRPTGAVYRVTDFPHSAGRKLLYRTLAGNRYSILGIVCSAEPILARWKWLLAFLLPAKVFVLNENGDYFWLDYAHWPTIRHFVLFRAGLAGAGAVPTLARLFLFPFTLLYLLLWAAAVHLARIWRRALS